MIAALQRTEAAWRLRVAVVTAVMDHRRWCDTAVRRRKREKEGDGELDGGGVGGIERGEGKKGGALQMSEPALGCILRSEAGGGVVEESRR